VTCDVEFLHPGQFYTRLLLRNKRRSIVRVFVDRQIQYLKCRVFIVVLLSVGNNLATLPGQTADHKFKWQFRVFLEEESVDFQRELRASRSTWHGEMVKAGEGDSQRSDANNGRSKAIES